LIAASDQVFFGDEGNDAKRLSGYGKVDLHTSYDISENIQIYGLIDNLFDARYGLFGNFFNLEAGNEGAAADGLGDDFFTDARTITPAPPFAAYGGVKMKF
jgi:outer membrane receptor for ferrienterochelin and colicin